MEFFNLITTKTEPQNNAEPQAQSDSNNQPKPIHQLDTNINFDGIITRLDTLIYDYKRNPNKSSIVNKSKNIYIDPLFSELGDKEKDIIKFALWGKTVANTTVVSLEDHEKTRDKLSALRTFLQKCKNVKDTNNSDTDNLSKIYNKSATSSNPNTLHWKINKDKNDLRTLLNLIESKDTINNKGEDEINDKFLQDLIPSIQSQIQQLEAELKKPYCESIILAEKDYKTEVQVKGMNLSELLRLFGEDRDIKWLIAKFKTYTDSTIKDKFSITKDYKHNGFKLSISPIKNDIISNPAFSRKIFKALFNKDGTKKPLYKSLSEAEQIFITSRVNIPYNTYKVNASIKGKFGEIHESNVIHRGTCFNQAQATKLINQVLTTNEPVSAARVIDISFLNNVGYISGRFDSNALVTGPEDKMLKSHREYLSTAVDDYNKLEDEQNKKTLFQFNFSPVKSLVDENQTALHGLYELWMKDKSKHEHKPYFQVLWKIFNHMKGDPIYYSSENAYKLTFVIENLANIFGDVVMEGCKSAKDRTTSKNIVSNVFFHKLYTENLSLYDTDSDADVYQKFFCLDNLSLDEWENYCEITLNNISPDITFINNGGISGNKNIKGIEWLLKKLRIEEYYLTGFSKLAKN